MQMNQIVSNFSKIIDKKLISTGASLSSGKLRTLKLKDDVKITEIQK